MASLQRHVVKGRTYWRIVESRRVNGKPRTVVGELGIKLDILFYDTTNFFTCIASTNGKAKLAQRGHSKQKRDDLRLFSLALLVSREGRIPLCSQVYEGNRVDSKLFPDSLSRIRERLAAHPRVGAPADRRVAFRPVHQPGTARGIRQRARRRRPAALLGR